MQCEGSALSKLYYVGLGRVYPDSVVSTFDSYLFPWCFHSSACSLDFTGRRIRRTAAGKYTFSFNTGVSGANTTTYNLFHVLPMTTDELLPLPTGTGVVLPYNRGPGAGKAVYDTITHLSWPFPANLAAVNNFGVTKPTTTITSMTNGLTVNVPPVDVYGGVYFAEIGSWIDSMNKSNFARIEELGAAEPCRSAATLQRHGPAAGRHAV